MHNYFVGYLPTLKKVPAVLAMMNSDTNKHRGFVIALGEYMCLGNRSSGWMIQMRTFFVGAARAGHQKKQGQWLSGPRQRAKSFI